MSGIWNTKSLQYLILFAHVSEWYISTKGHRKVIYAKDIATLRYKKASEILTVEFNRLRMEVL